MERNVSKGRDFFNERNLKRIGRNAGIFVLIYLVGIVAEVGFAQLGINTLIGFPVFILGILVLSLESDSGTLGIVLGVLHLASYDYFFAEPIRGFTVIGKTDIIALIVFLAVALIMNSITQRMRKQVEIAERNEAVMRKLNKVSTALINSTSSEEACDFSARFLEKTFGRKTRIVFGEPLAGDDPAALEAYHLNSVSESAEDQEEQNLYLPLSTKERVYGVVGIDCSEGELDSASRSFLSSVITQTVIAIERNELENGRKSNELKLEHEQFKTALLSSVSHDLRTPLTSIAGNADLLLHDSDVDEATRKELVESISKDADWLSEMVENLLSMTRIQDSEDQVKKVPELVDDVVDDAVVRERRYQGEHTIEVDTADEVLMVPMDGKLISQVLINLIDNAIKHTRANSHITVSAWREGAWAHFAVSDDGGGISPDQLGKVFNRFYTTARPRGRQGIGLGLSICKAIVEAHGGRITARNNDKGGATFEFVLPMEEAGTDE